jgi:hypothetical protein
MRLRVGLLLCLFAAIAAVGCRKPLTPNVDRNKAPETWITAAPFDTITLVKGQRPLPGTIPIRFHVYWAGGDQDGAVVGYYWAVVETLPFAPEGGTPPLPGPTPRDYHYTTRSDSTFIFDVAEDVPDRQHAFFVYAVDDKGKPDPTPARFIFNALDRFPPLPVFDEASATGTRYFFDSGGVLQSEVKTFAIHDTTAFGGGYPPVDTVPSGSRLTFKFHGQITVAGGVVKGFRYKLDEALLQPADPDSLYHGGKIEYHVPLRDADPARGGIDLLPVATGTKVFTLRAVDQAQGSYDRYRRFQMNFSPDTWIAGPDPGATGGPWQTTSSGEKFALLVNGQLPPGGLPGTLLNSDSVQIMPVNRVARRTFLEVYADTVFLRHEFDTVHLGSWVIVYSGGFDSDSPYQVKVADDIKDFDPNFPDGPVLRKDNNPNGSPIGFRSLITNYLSAGVVNDVDINGPLSVTSQSRLYPFFDPNDVLNFQRIGAYHPMTQSGKAYSLQRAEDGDGSRDNRVGDARSVVEFPGHEDQRPLVLVFYVNFPPVLRTDDSAFRPSATVVDTFKSFIWDLHPVGADRDPYASGDRPGGPSFATTLRYRFKLVGKDLDGKPLTFLDPAPNEVQQRYISGGGEFPLNWRVPDNLGSGPATLTIELCDCSFCELTPGEGRCIRQSIQVYYVRPGSGPPTTASRPGLD